jgi:hypothetical protein
VNFMSQIADLGKGWKRKSHKRTWTWAWLGLCGWQSLSDYSRLIAVTVHRTTILWTFRVQKPFTSDASMLCLYQ